MKEQDSTWKYGIFENGYLARVHPERKPQVSADGGETWLELGPVSVEGVRVQRITTSPIDDYEGFDDLFKATDDSSSD